LPGNGAIKIAENPILSQKSKIFKNEKYHPLFLFVFIRIVVG
jgi:hypothetical protein